MKILHLSAQKPDATGSGVYIRETIASLHRLGHEQAIVAGIGPEDEPTFAEGVIFSPVRFETEALPFPVVGMSNVMPYKATRYRDLTPTMTQQFKEAFASTINGVLDEFTPDLIICHHLYLLCAVVTNLVETRAQTDNALASCTVCGLSHSTDLRQFQQIPLERAYIADGVRKLDRIYSLHDAQAEEITSVFDIEPARIRVVGTGYDSSVFRELPDLRDDNAAKVVYVGKIYQKKGVLSLLKSFERLLERIPNAHLTLAGGYSDEDEYNTIVEYARSHNIPADFTGRLDHPDLALAYNRANVFVLPSFFEGLPLVAIEALACGCKAVLTDLPGLRPWIQANVEGGVIEFVEPPRMVNVDTPLEEDLPEFELQLTDALERALKAPCAPCDTSQVSWDALATRLL